MKRKPILWVLIFLGVFLLSQEYLFMTWENKMGFLGFPSWLAWFVFVHVLFIVVFYFFTKKYWKE